MKYLTVLFLFSRGSSLPSSFLDRNHGLLQEQTYCGQNLEKILLLARIYNWSESLVFYYSASSHHCSASDWYVFVYLLMWHFVIVFISTFNVRFFFLLYYCDRLFTWMLRHLFFLVRVVYKYYQLISTNFNFSDQKHWLPSSSRIWEKSWQKSKWLWTQCNV